MELICEASASLQSGMGTSIDLSVGGGALPPVNKVLTVQFQISLCTGCLDEERTALLQIKSSMSQYTPHENFLSDSWHSGYDDNEGGGSSDCCGWRGVECNITTGKVIKLDLSRASLRWPLNASVFTPFEDLTHLDLSYCRISSWVPDQGLGRSFVLPKLRTLILEGNRLNNTILPSLGGLSSLRTLSLSWNNFNGLFNFQEFRNMTNLYELDLEGNSINAVTGLGGLHALDKLEVLKLGSNNLNNSILPSLDLLHSTLKVLSLENNEFTGSFDVREHSYMINLEELDLYGNPGITDLKGLERLKKLSVLYLRGLRLNESGGSVMQSLGHLPFLKTLDISYCNLQVLTSENGSFGFSNLLELDLSSNNLEGMIPSWLGNFTSLRYLDLSYNKFEGNLALSPVANLYALERIVISSNNLEIPVSLTSFFNHSKLKVLETDGNRLLSDKVDQFHLPGVIPKFKLQLLSFSNCGSENLITRLPDFFQYQSDLRVLDLSQINLAMPFPTWLLENNTLLEQCKMRNNSLTGSFLFPSHRIFPHTTVLDISDNRLGGQVLENIGRMFPRLIELNMSGNPIGGRVPTSIGKLKYLEMLDLSNNSLSGEIPTIPSLLLLRLSHNNLSGQLPSSLYNLTALEFLYLDDNHFVGEIADNFPAFSLLGLDLSNNHISGKLPRWIGNMTSLSSFAMASNHLEGSIPVEFCHLDFQFGFLDLSDNELSGSIPSCFNPPYIVHVHLNRNKLSGPMTRAFYRSSSLVTLDLHDNNFTGAIPGWIGNLPALSVLILKKNKFEGEIPVQLCNLNSLSLLDLSQNSLSGQLPLCLSSMPFRAVHSISSTQRYSLSQMDYQYPADNQYPSGSYESTPANQQVEFSTKYGSYSYKGSVLDLISGIDLSCNHLTGEIPQGLGNLRKICALNLSHNHLTGAIPTSFSNLTAVESLDLSYNNLSGRIPLQLVELSFLGSFSVAHNNLSGPVPDRKAQFGTFDEKSYEGNPQLCGPPLQDSCGTRTKMEPAKPQAPEQKVKHDDDDDMVDFYASCVASYVTVLIIIVAIFVINPRWRRVWFYSIEVWMTSSYYFGLDTFNSLVNRRVVV